MIISRIFTVFVKTTASCERINEIFLENIEENTKDTETRESDYKGTLEFDKVSFSYCADIDDIILDEATSNVKSYEWKN